MRAARTRRSGWHPGRDARDATARGSRRCGPVVASSQPIVYFLVRYLPGSETPIEEAGSDLGASGTGSVPVRPSDCCRAGDRERCYRRDHRPGSGSGRSAGPGACGCADEGRSWGGRRTAFPRSFLRGIGHGCGRGNGRRDRLRSVTRCTRSGTSAGTAPPPTRRGGGGAPGPEAPHPRRRPERGEPAPGVVRVAGSIDHGTFVRRDSGCDHRRAGGVGHLATQLARHRGAHVIGTASARECRKQHGVRFP